MGGASQSLDDGVAQEKKEKKITFHEPDLCYFHSNETAAEGQDAQDPMRDKTYAKAYSPHAIGPHDIRAHGKENVENNTESRRSERIANKTKTSLTMEKQATQLLMKKSGMIEQNIVVDEVAHSKFRVQSHSH